ncbi:hypothetical protein MOC30_14675 [Bacillus spizizenii]|nr:hypothetical protein [Bacillus spizizenii]
MPARFYFYDKDMNPIETELSDLSHSYTGSWVAVNHESEWKILLEKIGDKTIPARTHIGVFENESLDSNTIDITIDNFKDHEIVICLFSIPYTPCEDDDWFILRAKKEDEEYADRVNVKGRILI